MKSSTTKRKKSPSKKPTSFSTPPNYPFNQVQEMLTFALIADIESGRSNTKKSGTKAAGLINKFLIMPEATKELPNWKLVYSPAIYAKGGLAANTTMIFYNNETDHMVIGVAGTNSVSTYDWFVEDFEVANLVPWNNTIMTKGPNNTGHSNGGFISKGTATALMNTWITPNSNNVTPVRWLHDNVGSSAFPTKRISVTGHSLGGAISPSLAMALKDNPLYWNPNNLPISIDSYIFAGPTPGDVTFRSYTENSIPVYSTKNSIDVVPHAWEIDKMNELYAIFSSALPAATGDNNGKIVYWLIRSLIAQSQTASSKGHVYERWTREAVFTGQLGPSIPTKTAIAEVNKILTYLPSKNVQELNTITGTTTKKALTPYMVYFTQYMGHLGEQHTAAYMTKIFNNPLFESELATLYHKPGSLDKIYALGVFQQLTDYIYAYYQIANSKGKHLWTTAQ